MNIQGINANSFICHGDNVTIKLEDSTWGQNGDYTFTNGSFLFKNNVRMRGLYKFVYQSPNISIIRNNSVLWLDQGFTFSYDPIYVASKDLLKFESDTSVLILDNATFHATTTGCHFKKGKMLVRKASALESEMTFAITDGASLQQAFAMEEGITIGNDSASDDFICEIEAGGILDCKCGMVNYRNTSPYSIYFNNDSSTLKVGDGSILKLLQNFSSNVGKIELDQNSYLARKTGKQLNISLFFDGVATCTVF
jgi:hypothetical protein